MARPPVKPTTKNSLPNSTDDINQFLDAVENTPVTATSEQAGKLIFALDATASRQATWDEASALQADMFTKTKGLSALKLQLVYFRGHSECRASPWLDNSAALLRMMNKISCIAGRTQIARVLKHAIGEARQQPVQAMVFVGDAMEENIDMLGELAGQLKILGLPVFIFQEGHDPITSMAFEQIAQISGGAHCRFDQSSAHQLGQLLNAVAIYAAGGRDALKRLSGQGSEQANMLLEQLG